MHAAEIIPPPSHSLYRRAIEEDPGITLRIYLLRCARAMDFCDAQVTDPLDVPPRAREPSSYLARELEDAEAELTRLASETDESRHARWVDRRGRVERANAAWSESDALRCSLLAGMRERVLTWVPPTPAHEGLRAFALQHARPLPHHEPVEAPSFDQFVRESLDAARRRVSLAREAIARDEQRVAESREWVAALYASLPIDDVK